MNGKIADPSLSSEGEVSYQWAYNHMDALTKTIENAAGATPLQGRRVAVCLHVTKETSVLIMGLKKLGGDVYLCGANPLTTQDDIAAYLSSSGITVHAWRGQSTGEYVDSIKIILRNNPDIIMDDGSDLHSTIHQEDEFSNLQIIGGTEETTTGVTRINALEKSGLLKYPIIAVNNAQTKHLFDNRYGTGQSTFDGILRATSLLMAGKKVVVCGYGWVGRGIARRAGGLDAHVIVTEVDPVKALEAHMDGFEVMTMGEAAKYGDLFITTTGQIGIIRGEHMDVMKSGAIMANAGHFDVEVDVKYLEQNKVEKKRVRPFVDEYSLKNGSRLYLIGEGRIVNLVAAEGHPAEVMMMSFSNQLLSAVHIAKNHEILEKKVYNVPDEIDGQVARNALHAMGVNVDKPTQEQMSYVESWR